MGPIQRRDVLGMLIAGACARRATAASTLRPAREAVDHVVIGVADLQRGIAQLERLTGVRPAFGGSHPGRGTRNALLSLGARQYAELIAPDPAQGIRDQYDLPSFAEPRLLMWAASTAAIDVLAAQLEARVEPGSRVRPDGRVLRWRSLAVGEPGLVPFFIQWDAESVHPSEDAPKGCELAAVGFEAPDPAVATRALAEVGIAADVELGAAARVKVALQTPQGRVEL